jgi:hypothetical protein
MAKYAGRITNIFSKHKEDVMLEGADFEKTPENVAIFNTWWKRINIEHGLVFWLTGAFTMILLSLLAYSTVYKDPGVETSINFVVREGIVIGQRTFPFFGSFFLVMSGIMLFGTQFSVYGSNARIASENLVILDKDKFHSNNLSKFFYGFLWFQILAGIIIFSLGFTEPLALVVTGAVMNAFSMFIYSGMVLYTNLTLLDKPLRPSPVRVFAVGSAFLFYGAFSAYTIYLNVSKLFAI